MRSPFFVVLALFAAGIPTLTADVTLPAIFSDHAVLLKSEKVPVWGKADPGEQVTVSVAGKSASAKAGDDGKWTVALDLSEAAPGPFEMTVQGKNQIAIRDVVVGEVWLASGQSNMEWVLNNSTGSSEEVAASANPMLRQFLVKKNASPEPAGEAQGEWVVASPQTSGNFSAVAYYFGKRLQNEVKVPVGIVNATWGGTPSEAWTSREALATVPDLDASSERLHSAFSSYQALKKEFVEKMGGWLRETGREDRAGADPSAFAGVDISTEGWVPVQVPGEVRAEGLPDSGAVWLRREITIPAVPATNLGLHLPIDGFDSVYWNGKLLKSTTFETFAGLGEIRRGGPFSIPPSEVRPGRNVLAIRFFQPAGPARISGEPKAGGESLTGTWLAKAEYELPPVPADKPAPQPIKNPPGPQNIGSYLFNGMISPIVPYAIRGAIWYQGESNAGRAFQYRTAFPLMITDWRRQWNQGDFPFYFCQLANFQAKKPEPGESAWAELREAQTLTLGLPNTGQAILIDVGESADIHPRNKRDVGERLARIALARNYGKDVAYSGPVYDSVAFENGKAVVRFRETHGGLVAKTLPETYDVQTVAHKTAPLVRNSPKSQLEGFAVCGSDKVWHWADAKIEGEKVVVSSPQVPEPIAVRYAWSDNPTASLYNAAGFPAGPFRTDDFPLTTKDAKY
ncbi:MAG: sialate O-acetylesterase [Terrimicrobiaceae bacterium]|nr:sialate O-acetylesterase [Terrimicrobiaceae bacterium]